jgi:hypothetical protein
MLSSAGFVVSPLPLEVHEEIMRQAWRSYRRKNIRLPPGHPRAQAALYITFTRVSRTWRAFLQRLVWTEVQCSDPFDFILYFYDLVLVTGHARVVEQSLLSVMSRSKRGLARISSI